VFQSEGKGQLLKQLLEFEELSKCGHRIQGFLAQIFLQQSED
jgi:hypothetical protein